MEIALLRHGKPECSISGKLNAADFGRWITEYNESGISVESNPAAETIEKIKKYSFIVCSHLPRSIESAKVLDISTINTVSPLFRECEMPYADWQYPKLSIKQWAIIFRIFQFAGYSPNAESYIEIKSRLKECVDYLVQKSKEHGSVLFIGHGALIWLIHKHLVRNGWPGPPKSARQHWELGLYTQKT